MKSKKAKKSNLFVRFLGESMASQSALGWVSPLCGAEGSVWRSVSMEIASFWPNIEAGLNNKYANILQEKKIKAKYSQTRSANAKCKKMPVVCLQFFLLHQRKTEGPWAYSRYTGSSARAEGPTFLPLCRVSHIERGKVNWLWQRDRLRFSISNL